MSSTDPALLAELAALKAEVARLKGENARLARLAGMTGVSVLPPTPARLPVFTDLGGPVDAQSPLADKVRLFGSLFAGRSDIHALRWDNARTGAKGWVPAVRGGWRKGTRDREYLPLTEQVLFDHLAGTIHAGLYPLLPDDTCRLVVADFDGRMAMLDGLAYVKAARAVSVPALLELSRSGAGVHVWTFFEGPVTALTARRIGTGLLREAMAIRGETDLASYDRLFPSQDFLPSSGSMGNLIALPLHGASRKRGTTVFLDIADLEPCEDQWAWLSRAEKLTARDAERIAGSLRAVAVGPGALRLAKSSASRVDPAPPAVIRARRGATLSVERSGLTPALLSSIKHAASLANPEFFERQRQRRSTWDTPRFVCCYDEDLDWLHLPRGLEETLVGLVEQAGSRLELDDQTSAGMTIETVLNAKLRELQQTAVDACSDHRLSVLVAPPGAGKTVMGCALIAHHGVSALVLADRKPLLEQWRDQIASLLGVKAGQLGAGRSKLSGIVDVASLQTLARREDLAELLSGYGLVIVDECHHVPAAAFERAVRQIPARRWVGLTATPYRRDGLDELITMHCGPVRHTISEQPTEVDVLREVLVHRTGFTTDAEAIQEIYRDLVHDDVRTRLIVDDVVASLGSGRHCLILTQWTQHLEVIDDQLRNRGHDPVVLRGGMGVKQRRIAMQRLEDQEQSLILATGSFLGEGFDHPALDTLFLAFPVVFRGRVVQYAGRVVRPHPGKTSIEVHDYVDTGVPQLARAHEKRVNALKSIGFVL